MVRPPPIRHARGGDAPGIVALIGRVFREYGFVWDPATEVPDLLDGFPGRYGPPAGAFWVGEEDGLVVGSVGVERLDVRTAELHRLYVDPGLRRRGLGLALVGAVQDWCRDAGIPRLMLWSDTRFDRAHALYARLGFTRTDERELPGDVNQTREYRYDLDLRATPLRPGPRAAEPVVSPGAGPAGPGSRPPGREAPPPPAPPAPPRPPGPAASG